MLQVKNSKGSVIYSAKSNNLFTSYNKTTVTRELNIKDVKEIVISWPKINNGDWEVYELEFFGYPELY